MRNLKPIYSKSFQIIRWLMGGLGVVGYVQVLNILPFVVCGAVVLLTLTRELNLLSTGEDIATSRGVNVRRTKMIAFFVTSLMVGGIVAVCGPIGFVGMMVPHICRLIFGADHRYLTSATILFGGTFLTVCDTVARSVLETEGLPVGIITAFLGGPFFLLLLLFRSPERIV